MAIKGGGRWFNLESRGQKLAIGTLLVCIVASSSLPFSGLLGSTTKYEAPETSSSSSESSADNSSTTSTALLAAQNIYALGSFGIEPKTTVAGRLPGVYNPLTTVAVRQLPGDRQVGKVRLGPIALFPALGNNAGVGDCAIVTAANINQLAAIHFDRRYSHTTTNNAIATWLKLKSSGSVGVTDSSLLSAWAAPTGILNSRIAGWKSINVQSVREIKSAIMMTGGLYASLVVPENLSWSSLIWEAIPSATAPVVDHSITLAGWTRDGWIAISWGEVILIPWSYWSAEAMSAYAVSPHPLS